MGRLFYFTGLFSSFLLALALFWFSNNVLVSFESIGDVRFNTIFLAIVIALSIVVTWRTSQWLTHLFLPTMIILFSYGLLFFISSSLQRSVFIVGMSLLYYIALLAIMRIRRNAEDFTAKSFFSIVQIVTFFLFAAVAYAIYINFAIPLWVFMIVVGFFVYFLTYVSLLAHIQYSSRFRLYGIVMAFAMMQMVWLMNFWPFNYTTMAVTLVAMYYVLWDIVHMYFLGKLTSRRIIADVTIVLIGIACVLMTARWVL